MSIVKWKRHAGSTIAIILGFLTLLSDVNNLQPDGFGGGLILGPVIILGAFAYRLAKKRRTGEAIPSVWRIGTEALLLVIVLAALLLQDNLKEKIVTDPFPLTVVLWIVAAYAAVNLVRVKPVEPPKTG